MRRIEWRRGNERTTAKDQFIDRASAEDMKRGVLYVI
jgi:hypothetical protein